MSETEEFEEVASPSVGDRLRAAREEKGLTLEDIASQTRIPRRHLEAIEAADWERLPAPTYTIGFAKSYASAVGLDRNEVSEDVRAEMGTPRQSTTTEIFEPVDPARTMPRWLVLGAIGAIILVVIVLTWLNQRALEPEEAALPASAAPAAAGAEPAVQPSAAANPATRGPVVLTATERVWIQVYEEDGRTLFQGELGDGQRYTVPASATAPLLRTGKPEALRVTVGQTVASPVGPPARVVSDVSLLPHDLLGLPAPQRAGAGAPPTTGNAAG